MDLKKEEIKKISILITDSIIKALKQMDAVDKKLLLVFQDEKFSGLLSIGDIQRAIIRNINLELPVGNILRKNVKVAYSYESFQDIKDRMLKLRTECMPVLDEKNNLVDVYFWDELFGTQKRSSNCNLNLPVVIMAGGMGLRLKPLTNILPKPLFPIGEKTIVEHIIDKFLKIGCNHFYISINYKAKMIRQYFNDLPIKDYTIEFFEETKPLGTIGSLYLLKDKISTPFFVSNCDILIDQDYEEIYSYHQEQKNEITLVAALKHLSIPYGTLESGEAGQLISFREKPEFTFKINSGLYILEPSLLNQIPENTFYNITELIDKIHSRKGKIGVFPVNEKAWKDIGEWDGYLRNYNG